MCLNQHISSLLFKVTPLRERTVACWSLAPCAGAAFTFLCWEDCGNGTERTLPTVVVGPNLHIEWGEGRDGVVPEDVAGNPGCGDHRSCPGNSTQRPKSNDVTKSLSVLQFLRHGLGAKQRTIVILKRIQTKTQTTLFCLYLPGKNSPDSFFFFFFFLFFFFLLLWLHCFATNIFPP